MSKKMLIILIVAGFLFLGFVGAGFYIVVNKISALGPQAEVTEPKEASEEKPKETIGPLFDQDAFVVNLADPGGKRYLRVGLSLELSDELKSEEIKKRLPQVRHLILMALSAKKLEDIQTLEGKTALRDQLIGDLNVMLKEPIIKNLYFTEFVVQ